MVIHKPNTIYIQPCLVTVSCSNTYISDYIKIRDLLCLLIVPRSLVRVSHTMNGSILSPQSLYSVPASFSDHDLYSSVCTASFCCHTCDFEFNIRLTQKFGVFRAFFTPIDVFSLSSWRKIRRLMYPASINVPSNPYKH